MLIVQRGDQRIDWPAIIGWGFVFFVLFSPFALLTANVVMRPAAKKKPIQGVDPEQVKHDEPGGDFYSGK